jgi:hypothetical protein
MRPKDEELYEELSKSPEDWSLRLRLIESAVVGGDMAKAKRLVRESPDEGPLPAELQARIYYLMTAPVVRPIGFESLPRAEG